MKQPRRQPKKPLAYHSAVNTSYQPAHRQRLPQPVMPPPGKTPKPKKRRLTWGRAIALLLLLIFIPFLVIGIWDYRNFSGASQKLFGSNNVLELATAKPVKSTPEGRTNILLIGYSVDDPDHAGAQLTDSILIVSLDSTKKSGYMLSIPRDLYVEVPVEDYGYAKINEAYQAGERYGFNYANYKTGGVGTLEKIINDTVGIPIHYHAIINYGAVREIVDALGGITVDIQSSDPRGLYDPNFQPDEGGPLQLANGPQRVDGQTALKLTRARGAEGGYGFALSDFVRTKHQQQVFAAIQKELSWKLVLDPRTNGKIFTATANNVVTDVKLSEVLTLYRLLNAIPEGQLKPVPLRELNGINLLRGYNTRSGQSALVPNPGVDDYSEIRAYIQKLNQ